MPQDTLPCDTKHCNLGLIELITYKAGVHLMLARIATLPFSAGSAIRRPKEISVLSETGQAKLLQEWAGEASVVGFEILPQPSERLCTQKSGGSISFRRGRNLLSTRGSKWTSRLLSTYRVPHNRFRSLMVLQAELHFTGRIESDIADCSRICLGRE